MRKILHLLTKTPDSLAEIVIQAQQSEASNDVTVINLTAPSPDYAAVVQKLFESDSVQTW